MMKLDAKKVEILFLSIILALCSIVYELLLSNTLAIVTSNYIWWQAMTIGVYIGGLGLGAFRSQSISETYSGLLKTELALSFLGALSVIWVYLWHSGLKYYDTLIYFTNGDFYSSAYVTSMVGAKILFFVIVQSLVFFIGFFSGFEIPLLMRMRALDTEMNEEQEHFILGVSYLGTLVGTLCFAYVFLPKLDVLKTSIFISFLNLLVCLYMLLKYVRIKQFKYGSIIVTIFILIATLALNEKMIIQRYLKFFYYHQDFFAKLNVDFKTSLRNLDKFKDIERFKSPYQYIDIMKVYYRTDIKDENPTMMTLDHRFQFSTNTEAYYHQAFAHVPLALNGKPVKNIAVLGGGDGLLIRELLRHKEIESIRIIELDPMVVQFAKTRFSYLNKHSYDDPRVHLEINDAFYILRNSDQKYDAIYIDFPYPNNYDLAKLFSVEFYKYVFMALRDDGFVAFDAPIYKKADVKIAEGGLDLISNFNENHFEANSILISTVYYAGFRTIFPYVISRESFMFLKKAPGGAGHENLMSIDQTLFLPEVYKEIGQLHSYNFPYEISPRFVNSIFKPTIFRGEDP